MMAHEQRDGKSCCLSFSWASSDDVWIKMLNKELKYVHDKSYLQRHPKLQPKMRAILLDWLLEVRTELNWNPVENKKNKGNILNSRTVLKNVCVCAQVSEVYSLHRQTAYLAQDYFDRFMLTEENVGKDYLQLLGITALFIASKIEVSPSSSSAHHLATSTPTHRSVQRMHFNNSVLSPGNLPSQDLRVRLCHGWSLRYVGHPADGASHAKGTRTRRFY